MTECTISRRKMMAGAGPMTLAAPLAVTGHAKAADYAGKTINFVSFGGPGSPPDVWYRSLMPFVTKHLPGTPEINVINKPGAGSMISANYTANAVEPDGLNINDGCGSTHMETLRAAVVSHGADLGLAHDGDADRCLAVAADGSVIDGDAIMVVLALAMQEAGELASDTLVATVMSNLGLHLAMRAAGVQVRTTGVGDRYVLEELRAGEFSLGGEQSGHIVLPAFGTTGDGIVTGLRLMARMAQTRRSLAALAEPMQTLPQVLINVQVTDKATVAQAPSVQEAVAQAEAELGDTGRILLRPSGTEQMVRVMVEAADEDTARQLAARVAESVSAQN